MYPSSYYIDESLACIQCVSGTTTLPDQTHCTNVDCIIDSQLVISNNSCVDSCVAGYIVYYGHCLKCKYIRISLTMAARCRIPTRQTSSV